MSAPHVQILTIPSGYRGTLAPLAQIADLVRRGAKDFAVRRQAVAILRNGGVRAKDYLGEIKALFQWVQSHIRYTRDTFRVELLHSPRRMLELRAGDCDDMAVLLGAVLESVGHPVRLVITGRDPNRPELFSHIYVEAWHRDRWIALDATMPHPMGWAPVTPVKRIVSLRRNPAMPIDHPDLLGAVETVPERLHDFLRSLRGEAIAPRDGRVKMVWELLRSRRLLGRDPWVKQVLRRIWELGLRARPRPRTHARLVQAFHQWGLLPSQRGTSRGPLGPNRPGRPVRLRPLTPHPRPIPRPPAAAAGKPRT
ncbi:MAG: transglutaminase domain-containing protein [Methylococcaceae bacterium]|nr:transglutaminase domain-containing protein [Methylococcaceae bacterium]